MKTALKQRKRLLLLPISRGWLWATLRWCHPGQSVIESSGATRDSFIFLINKFGRVNCVTVLLAAPGAISAFLVRGHSRVPFLLCAWWGGGLQEPQRWHVLFLLNYLLILGQVALLWKQPQLDPITHIFLFVQLANYFWMLPAAETWFCGLQTWKRWAATCTSSLLGGKLGKLRD